MIFRLAAPIHDHHATIVITCIRIVVRKSIAYIDHVAFLLPLVKVSSKHQLLMLKVSSLQLTVVGHPEASLTLPAGKVLLVSLKSTQENQPIVIRCTPLVP